MTEMKYCMSCGNTLSLKRVSDEEPERHVCDACGTIQYENPIPTAGALIVQDGKLLLVRRAVDPYKGAWDIPGGFIEKHEHPEDALKREMREELEIDIAINSLVGIFMGTYEGTMSTINVYYAVAIASGTPSPHSDIDAVEWFPLDALPEIAFEQNADAIEAFRRHS